jgi:demethylmenaquinone methyltransferase/2-methoxy-6-polyprenyl-1,4-benzoquinol methylase
LAGKTGFLQTVFAEVPKTYELVNHVLTLGLDVRWRKRAARIAAAASGGRWADMCTGTGEMAGLLSNLAPAGTKILAVDASLPMLREAASKPNIEEISFVSSDVRELPFPDESLDFIAMSFATRNVNLNKEILIQTFHEYCRVLKPGGTLVNLETSSPPNPLIRNCLHTYVKLFVRFVGGRISGSRTAYNYLAKTIPRFYSAEELADIMRISGLGDVSFEHHFFGVVAIHTAKKPRTRA